MHTATELLTRYAAYHRDRRNISSHFVGVPMIVLALGVLLSRPMLVLNGLAITPAWLLFVAASAWYLTRGQLGLGLAVSASVGALMLVAHRLGDAGTGAWLAWGLGFSVVGWTIQVAGHWYEGKRPASVSHLSSLLVGPMFVVAEAMFMLGWNKRLADAIEQKVGPTTLRDAAKIA